jgi:hypothetical protein
MTRWRNRMGEERLQALLRECLAVATRTGAMKPGDLARVSKLLAIEQRCYLAISEEVSARERK